jgi:hypothetical protein
VQPPRDVRLAEAARIYRIPPRTLRDWCAKDRLTWKTDINMNIYVDLNELAELVEMRHAATERLANVDYCP